MSDADSEGRGASTLELFFDLVFVFTITQFTHAFVHDPSWTSVGTIALLFSIVWWMYSGYVWLTNEVAPTTPARRTVLVAGMFGFFTLAMAAPDAVHGHGTVFGWAFLGVTVIHAVLFRVSGGESASAAIARVAPTNMAAAVCVVIGGYTHGTSSYLWWGAGLVIIGVSPFLSTPRGFVLRTGHFCERHGLVLIIAIGESIIGVGTGLAEETMNAQFFAQVLLGLTVVYVMWWSFFGTDAEHGEQALDGLPVEDRPRPALLAYGYCFVPMLLGIVFAAAGLGMSIGHGEREASWASAGALAGGVALYLAGQAAFRTILGLPRPYMRLLAAALAVGTMVLGVHVAEWLQLAAIAVVVYAAIIADDVIGMKRGEKSSYLAH
ncbi:low temperature requirement protein A [Gordonia spumicola]|uniref:Low temperature requirement protein A n=1 Tax=Gordonia spumicola TaxID=589161 RepID=A0A7I9VAV2_9ACTN|nr:low temperature requirement protein A [Gordonia spumicola]GEE02140.1 low temperature requirement protein A [Gordonia spumicola]